MLSDTSEEAVDTSIETDTTASESDTSTPPAESGSETQDAKDASSPSKTLLDDEDVAAESETPESNAPSAEDIEAFCKGIDVTDLGDGVEWSDPTLKAIAPALMELTGNDPKKANGVVKAYATFVQEQARQQQEVAEAFTKGLVNECKARFGADLKKVAKFAREGGRAIFGDNLWSALKSTPAFANNPDVIERLADYGRRLAEDTGATKPTTGAKVGDEMDVLQRMYNHVNVG
jgi:hypothetical protein